jgi:ABC-2 type transport system ATP-binding protein
LIEVKNLVKNYGKYQAVKDISFSVEDGEILGFLGPNGAGKSTTMNIITGYISATSGTVTIDGFDILKNPKEAKTRIGYLPEIPPVYMDMTVTEYLKFVAELKRVKKNEIKPMLDDIMEKIKITHVSGKLIKNLSKGYRQRVGLAQALVGYPDVLILDEPSVGLDPKQIIEIRDVIKELGKSHTIILSSHILSEVSAICTRVMIINKGRIVAVDTPERLSDKLSGDRYKIRLKGERNSIISAFNSCGKFESIEEEDCAEEGCIEITVCGKEGIDPREAAFETAKENGFVLLIMKSEKLSLEDVFLKVTEESENMEFTKEASAETENTKTDDISEEQNETDKENNSKEAE